MTIQVGDRVVITGDSPWRGYSGVVVGYEDTPFGSRPLIVLDNGMRTFAMRDDHVQLAARRGEAQGEEDVTEFCHLCGEDFDPRESGTVTGPIGQDDGVPRWYRCPRCARAYDAGYQQGQRDPRGDGSYSAA